MDILVDSTPSIFKVTPGRKHMPALMKIPVLNILAAFRALSLFSGL